MMQPSNTPPDGDFVRYVEKLTQANAQASQLAKTQVSDPRQAAGIVTRPAVPVLHQAVAAPNSEDVLQLLKAFPWFTHLQWLVVMWVAFQVIGQMVPGLGYLFVPALVAYIVWAFVQANQASSGALSSRLRSAIETAAAKAADEAGKARQAQQQKIQQLQQKNRK